MSSQNGTCCHHLQHNSHLVMCKALSAEKKKTHSVMSRSNRKTILQPTINIENMSQSNRAPESCEIFMFVML